MRPGVHQTIEHDRHRGFEANDPERRAIELDHLLVDVMRRVVGRDHVDAAVGNALEHGVAVGGFAQRRIHLEVGVVLDRAVERVVGQGEVMRRDLARHVHAAFLARAHRAQRLPRAHVRDVHVCAGELGQRNVALDHDRLGFARNAAQPEMRRDVTLRARRRRLSATDPRSG